MKKTPKQKVYVLITTYGGVVSEISLFGEADYDKMRRKFIRQCRSIDSEFDVKDVDLDRGHDTGDKCVTCEVGYLG